MSLASVHAEWRLCVLGRSGVDGRSGIDGRCMTRNDMSPSPVQKHRTLWPKLLIGHEHEPKL